MFLIEIRVCGLCMERVLECGRHVNGMYLNFLVKTRILFFQQHSLDHLPVFGADRAVQLPGLHSTEAPIRTSLHCTIKRECVLPVFPHCSSKQTVWTALGPNIRRQGYCNRTSRGCEDAPLKKRQICHITQLATLAFPPGWLKARATSTKTTVNNINGDKHQEINLISYIKKVFWPNVALKLFSLDVNINVVFHVVNNVDERGSRAAEQLQSQRPPVVGGKNARIPSVRCLTVYFLTRCRDKITATTSLHF